MHKLFPIAGCLLLLAALFFVAQHLSEPQRAPQHGFMPEGSAAERERQQERRAAAHALTALCTARHIHGTYVSPEEMRAFARCFDGR